MGGGATGMLWHLSRVYLVLTLPFGGHKNETMAPLHVATLTVKRELPK